MTYINKGNMLTSAMVSISIETAADMLERATVMEQLDAGSMLVTRMMVDQVESVMVQSGSHFVLLR